MTTATTPSTAATVLAGLVVVGVGFAVAGSTGGLGAGVGTVLVTTVLASGAAVVGLTARVLPAASLLVALLTYTLQLVLVVVVMVALADSPAVAERLSASWFAGAVIACALTWTVAQVVVSTRVRIPAYDLPRDASLPTATTPERGAR